MTTATQTTTVQLTRRFPASAERVFDAWLDPQMARRFLFSTPTGTLVKAEIDPRVGGRFLFVDRRDGEDVEHHGTYLEINRPRRLAFTFLVPKFSLVETRISIDIAPNPAGCELKLTHQGVFVDWAERAQGGWKAILTGLEATINKPGNTAQPFATLTAPHCIAIERLLPGPIERVWQYITDSEKRGTWFGTGVMEEKAGSTFMLFMRNSDLSTVPELTPPQYAKHDTGHISECRITQCDPPRLLGFLWDDAHEITITLTPVGDKVALRLTHQQRKGNTPMSEFAAAWHTHLDFLTARLEGREPGAFWKAFAEQEAAYEARSQHFT